MFLKRYMLQWLPPLLLHLQVLHLGDPALHDPQDEQTRPEDPEGAGGG